MGQFDARSGITRGTGFGAWGGGGSLPTANAHIRRASPRGSKGSTAGRHASKRGAPDEDPWRLSGDVARWIGSLALLTLPIAAPPGVVGSRPIPLDAAAAASGLEDLLPEHVAAMNAFRMEEADPNGGREAAARLSGTQSVARAMDILDAIAERPMMLPELALRVGLSTTTCYRLANALVKRGMLSAAGRSGYRLGERIGELGDALLEQQLDLVEDRPLD